MAGQGVVLLVVELAAGLDTAAFQAGGGLSPGGAAVPAVALGAGDDAGRFHGVEVEADGAVGGVEGAEHGLGLTGLQVKVAAFEGGHEAGVVVGDEG